MIIPLNLNAEKDKELIAWLNSKTNRSAFIRMKLYEIMRNEGEPILPKKTEKTEVPNSFLTSIDNM